MMSHRIVTTLLFASLVAAGQTLPDTLRVSDEIDPPGGLAQFKVVLTSPQPISTGHVKVRLPATLLGAVRGIALFSPSGKVWGAAVIRSGQVQIQIASFDGTFGTSADYPIMTMAVAVPPDALPGATTQVALDPSSILQDLTGSNVPLEFQPGVFTVGGSLSITNVVPGGGSLPAGTTVNVSGLGFTRQTELRVKEVNNAIVKFVSPNLFQVTFPTSIQLDGKLMLARNPDGSQVEYDCYLRGVPVGQSSRPLLAHTVPIFSIETAIEALMPPAPPVQVDPPRFTGLALQNPALTDVTITVEQYLAHQLMGSSQITLAPGQRMIREVSEITGVPFTAGTYVHLVAGQGVQVLGLLANTQSGTVLPFRLQSLVPGTFKP